MVTLKIDDETFAVWSRQAASQGLSVEDWLKSTTSEVAGDDEPARDWPIEERLRRFDSLTQAMKRMGIGSGGTLDDSRETIYGVRGL